MITVARLSDNTLSIRYDGNEMYILPKRTECSEDDIERMLHSVEEALTQYFNSTVTEEDEW